jgi:hypothetical protein
MSLAQIWRPQRLVDDPMLWPTIQAKGRRHLEDQYACIEGVLGDGWDWAIPQAYTVVDSLLLVLWRWKGRLGLDHLSGLDVASSKAGAASGGLAGLAAGGFGHRASPAEASYLRSELHHLSRPSRLFVLPRFLSEHPVRPCLPFLLSSTLPA